MSARRVKRYPVDPAGSHMLVLRAKPCTSQYERLKQRNCEWLITSAIIHLAVIFRRIPSGILGLIRDHIPTFGRDVLAGRRPTGFCHTQVNHGNITNRALPDVPYELLPYQPVGRIWAYRGFNG